MTTARATSNEQRPEWRQDAPLVTQYESQSEKRVRQRSKSLSYVVMYGISPGAHPHRNTRLHVTRKPPRLDWDRKVFSVVVHGLTVRLARGLRLLLDRGGHERVHLVGRVADPPGYG